MADVVGSIGVSAAQDSDLALATKGGPKFMARLQQLADAIDAHEQAFAKLKVGNDIAGALADAQAKAAAGAAALQMANDSLADARAKAKIAIDEANKQAAKIVAAANDMRQQAETDVTNWKAAAQQFADKTASDAKDLLKNAQSQMTSALRAQSDAKAATAQAEAAAKAHNAGLLLADAKAKEFQTKIDNLNAALRSVT